MHYISVQYYDALAYLNKHCILIKIWPWFHKLLLKEPCKGCGFLTYWWPFLTCYNTPGYNTYVMLQKLCLWVTINQWQRLDKFDFVWEHLICCHKFFVDQNLLTINLIILIFKSLQRTPLKFIWAKDLKDSASASRVEEIFTKILSCV